ncbi:MAG: carbohydrate-binding domain-containing protein [Haloarculaceae archaeon]
MTLTGTTVAGFGTWSRGSGDGDDRTTQERAATGSGSNPELLGFGYGGAALVESESLARRTPGSAERTSASGVAAQMSTEAEAEQSPFASMLPGRIQAESFDEGGEGVAYHDTDPQWDGRPESDTLRGDTRVDLQATSDVSGAYNVGRFRRGEWLTYTVRSADDVYTLKLRVATPRDGRQLRFKLDGETLRTVDIPNTGGWNEYQTVSVQDVHVGADRTGILRVEAVNSGIDFNWFEFEDTEDSPTPTATSTPTPDDGGDDYSEQGYGEYGYGGVA